MKRELTVIGIRPLMEAISSGKEIEKIYIQKGVRGDLVQELIGVIKDHRLVYHTVPKEKLNRISRKNHQGVIAYLSPVIYQNLENLVPMVFEQGEVPLFVALDRITDVRNFGAIARTAECAGAHGIIIPARGGTLINEDAMKASAGALNELPVCRYNMLEDALLFMKESGIQLIGATEKATMIYTGIDLKVPTAIVMGSEEDGISPRIRKLLDQEARIPILGKIESLNVSVAAGLFLYEVVRQRF